MTARDRLFETTVVDGGALGAAVVDVATRAVTAGYGHDGLVSPALLELLLGTARPDGASPARELMVAGRDRALYCTVLARGELVVLAAPVAMSVALGWALVRVLAAGEPAR